MLKISESKLNRIISESINEALSEKRLNHEGPTHDKYGNEIHRGGQGWGADDDFKNRQGYNADGTPGPWFSRSVAMATAVLIHDSNDGEWYVLANQRGAGTPDYQGYWNLPCGYLDYNETTEEGAAREVYEETGIKLNPSSMIEMGHSSDPIQNRQNVCYFYAAVINGSRDNYKFSTANMEENEVSGIKWVPLSDIGNTKWAFDHDELITVIMNKLGHEIDGNKDYDVETYLNQAMILTKQKADPERIKSILVKAINQL